MPGLEDLTEVGRLQLKGQFKAGMDESHSNFVVDNDSRETFEMWEACKAEGVRGHQVEPEVPERIQKLHENSLSAGRDVLEDASTEEKTKWLTKDGNDWSGAFGHDPKAYMDSKGKKRAEPGQEKPVHDPYNPSSDDDDDDDDDDDESGSSPTTANGKTPISPTSTAATSAPPADGRPSTDTAHTGGTALTHDTAHTNGGTSQGTFGEDPNSPSTHGGKTGTNAVNKRTEERTHRGLMQWKPARNAVFAKNQAKFAVRRAKQKVMGLEGREPDVETETGT